MAETKKKKATSTKKKPSPKKKRAAGSGGARGELFKKGGKGGPGRPSVKKEQEYLDAFREALSAKDFLSITKKQVELALEGDSKAVAVLFAYALGKPSDYMPVDTTPKTRRVISYVLGKEKITIEEGEEGKE